MPMYHSDALKKAKVIHTSSGKAFPERAMGTECLYTRYCWLLLENYEMFRITQKRTGEENGSWSIREPLILEEE